MKNLFAIIRISLVFAALGFCSTGSFAGTPWTWFGAWTNGTDTYYNVGFGIDDPSQASYSGATLSGGGLTSNGYFNGPGWETNIDFGSTQPSASIVYTGVVTAKSGVSTTTQFAQRATGFNVQYPTNIQPIGLVNDTNPVFTWSSPATQSSYVYGIDVAINTPWTPIWKQRNILGNTATYTGPALVPGTVYRVNVRTYEYDATNDSTYGAIRAEYFCYQCAGNLNYTSVSVESYKQSTQYDYGVSLTYYRFPGDNLTSYSMQCPNGMSKQGTFTPQVSGIKQDWMWFGFGSTQPVTPMTCSSTVTYADGSTNAKAFLIDHFSILSDFPTIAQPTNAASVQAIPPVTFTVPGGSNSEVKLWTTGLASNQRLWYKWNPQSPTAYDGPPLVPGTTYKIEVGSRVGDAYQHAAYTDILVCYQCMPATPGNVYDQIFIGRNAGPNGTGENYGASARIIRTVGDNLASYSLSCANGAFAFGTLSAVSANQSQWFNVGLGSTAPVTPLDCTATVTKSDLSSTSQAFTVDRIADVSRYVTNLSLAPNANVSSLSNVTFTAPTLAPGDRVQANIFTVNTDGSFGPQVWFIGSTASPLDITTLPTLTANTHYYLGIAVVDGTSVFHAAQTFVEFCYQCSSGTAGVTLSLKSGWNLLGNSGSLSGDVVAIFGDATKTLTVWKWVTSKSVWAFYTPSMTPSALATYTASKGYDVLTTVAPGEGVWVNAKIAFSVNVTASSPLLSSSFAEGQSLALASGWSLIAIGDSKKPRDFVNAIAPTPPSPPAVVSTALTSLWAWDAVNSTWFFYAPSLDNAGTLSAYVVSKSYENFGTTGMLLPGVGFWVNKP